MSTPNIVVLTAGMSLHSSSALLADRLKDATRVTLRESGVDPQVHTYHLSQYSHEIADHLSMGFPSGELAGLLQALREADAIITVSPTFKASYSGLFKSLWDLTEDGDIAGTPVLLGATGGTPRHSLMIEHAMRPLFAYLHGDIVNTAVFAATEDFGNASTLESRIQRAGAELAQKILWRMNTPQAKAAAAVERAEADDAQEAVREDPEHEGEPLPDSAGHAASGSADSAAEGTTSGAGAGEPTGGVEPADDAYAASLDADTDLAARDHSTRPPGPPTLAVTPFERLLNG